MRGERTGERDDEERLHTVDAKGSCASVSLLQIMVRLRLMLRDIPMPIDVIVYSQSDVEERQHVRGTMLYHALREGRILHDAA